MFYEKLNKEAKSKLITTTVYIFLMINKFGKIHKKWNNDIFTLDRKENEKSVNKFQAENEFYRLKMPCPTNNLHLLKTVGFGQAITF